MQKLINVLALSSFVVSAGVVAAGAYVYINRDALVDAAVGAAVAEVMPEIPDILGGDAIPSHSGVLPPITLPF